MQKDDRWNGDDTAREGETPSVMRGGLLYDDEYDDRMEDAEESRLAI